MGCTWAQLERLAHNREGWRKLIGGLYVPVRKINIRKKRLFFF
jgi:hypothetical protein